MNVSLPATVKKEIELAVKKGGYATKSEFIRDLMRFWKEQQLYKKLRVSRKQIKVGRGKTLRSLKSLYD